MPEETEGGISGSAGDGGFSTSGTSPTSSSATEAPPPPPLGFELEGAVFGPLPVPGPLHIVTGVIEAAHLIHTLGTGLGPILIVPHVLQAEPQPEASVSTDLDGDGIEG